jgi:predicted dehydrogenase
MTQVGIIGLGYWGPNIVRSMEQSGAKAAWLCDLRPDRLEPLRRLYPSARFTADCRDVLNDPGIDAVVVSTPVAAHFDLCRDALRAGKHVLSEKPLCDSSEKAAELIRLAGAAKKVLMVGHVFEYNASVEALHAYIRSGGLGTLYYLDFERTNLGPVRTDVNALWDLASHDLSMMRLFTGCDPVSVSASGGIFLNANSYDVAFATFSFPDGAIAHLHASWINPRKVRRVTVVGSRKMAVFDDISAGEPVEIYDKHVEYLPPEAATLIDSYDIYKTACVNGPMSYLPVKPNNPLQAECGHFLRCVGTGAAPRSDGYSGYCVIRCLEAAMESMRQGGRKVDIRIISPAEIRS